MAEIYVWKQRREATKQTTLTIKKNKHIEERAIK